MARRGERLLGRWLSRSPAGDSMVVATKAGARTRKPGDPSREFWQRRRQRHSYLLPLPGSRHHLVRAQLDELVGALDVNLDDETMARLDGAGRRRPE